MSLKEKSLLLKEDFDNVYEAGRSDYSNFIERAISFNGTRTDYKYAFQQSNFSGCTFGLGLIKPKAAGYMFYNYNGSYLPDGMDFSGITPTTTDNQGVYHAFRWAQIVYLPDLKIPGTVSHNYLVNNAKQLKKIECLHSLETTTFKDAFLNCNKLAEVSFEGVIGRDISFANSPLTVASMKNIITHLKDYAGTTSEYTYTVTLSSACKTALEAEGATSPNGNLWSEYIDGLGWTLL